MNPKICNDIAKNLQKDTAKYLFMTSEFFCHKVNTGTSFVCLDILFQGRVPYQMIIVFVSIDAFKGSYTRNPFNFQHCSLNYLDINVDGKSLPRECPIEKTLQICNMLNHIFGC